MISRILLALITAVTFTACSSAVEGEQSFDLSEFSIAGPARLMEGKNSLSVGNSGQFPHTLVIAADDGTVIAASDLIQPGETAQLELILEEGAYRFTCRIVNQTPDGEIFDHYEEGMVKTVSVQA